MAPLHLTHFTAALLFSLFASIVFGITQKNTPREMLRYAGYCFAMFVGGTVAAAWVMFGLRWLAMR